MIEIYIIDKCCVCKTTCLSLFKVVKDFGNVCVKCYNQDPLYYEDLNNVMNKDLKDILEYDLELKGII